MVIKMDKKLNHTKIYIKISDWISNLDVTMLGMTISIIIDIIIYHTDCSNFGDQI
jgi:hypothetical protein